MYSNRNLILAVLILPLVCLGAGAGLLQIAYSQETIDLRAPGGNENFGGDKMGVVTIVPKEHTIHLTATMSSPSKDGKVFEGWLVDVGGSNYKLSVGEFSKNGTLDYTATMVNPYTYSQFIVTEEPFEDPDPNAASTVAGAQLVSPFGL